MIGLMSKSRIKILRPSRPPFLRAGQLWDRARPPISSPSSARARGWPEGRSPGGYGVNQLQLTIADLVAEIHETHHPIGAAFYYEDQKKEAKRRSENFCKSRAPKFLGYSRKSSRRAAARNCSAATLSYADLSLFQIVEGLRYAFPKTDAAAGEENSAGRRAA